MPTQPRVAFLPLAIGLLLWVAAVALLTEDAIRTGHITVQHCLQPILAGVTVAAGIYAHRSLREWQPVSALGFLTVALLGSLLVIYATMGRQADARDVRQSEAQRQHRALEAKEEELQEAKRSQKAECVKIGPRCQQWNARVDLLTKEASQLTTASLDPRADALGELVGLLGWDGEKAKAIVSAIDPFALPAWLELSSIVFLSAAFPKRRKPMADVRNSQQLQPVVLNPEETVSTLFTRDMALRDFRRMKDAGSQRFLSERWGVDKSTVSRWLKDWETDGLVQRHRNGKEKPALALPAPKQT